jgi:CRISPR-associated endonuclease/helicase Cas3
VTPPDGTYDFQRLFAALTGTERPYSWQEHLFKEFLADRYPDSVCVPTGLGKTSLMHVWLLALIWEAIHRPGARRVPLRLVWVVDRRVVVDQATEEAEAISRWLAAAENEAARRALQALSVTGERDGALAVSTLRGERADNREWSRDPSRPAIVVGTVDMVGSRLLFSGYGDGRWYRPQHAGLLAQDTLVVNDEAHLTPAFATLLAKLRGLAGGRRTLRTILLSATPRDSSQPAFPESLDADLDDDRFRARYHAVKRIHLFEHETPAKEIHRLGMDPDRRTIIFVRKPADARKLAAAIRSKHKGVDVPLITGTQRGWERDRLLSDPVVRRFLSKEKPPTDPAPCWLVATSAGEVGINLSADRLISDLDTADHLLQRFGRLNRFGETEGDVYIVYSPKQIAGDRPDAQRLKATIDYLKGLPNASLEALHTQPPPPAAMSPNPHLAPLLPWHVDVWSMTSIPSSEWSSRPAVESWLRGDDEESAPPETYVAWREDIRDLADAGISESDREEVFACYPVLAQERLKQYTDQLCEDLGRTSYAGEPAVLISADGEIHAGTVGELLRLPRLFRFGTLLLPPGVGHLDQYGMVDWAGGPSELSRYDVSATETRTKVRIPPGAAAPELQLRLRHVVEIPAADEDEEAPRWMYFAGKVQQKAAKTVPLLLADHRGHVAALARELALRLGFEDRMAQIFEWAGHWHDTGKARLVWQRAAGNGNGSQPVAKCERINVRMLDGYRHELGSLLDAEAETPPDFTPEERDLALHLIAAHHGWARPYFPQRTFDKSAYRRSVRAALGSARRLGRLQHRYGAWGLAYLEAIFRAADAIASADAPELPVNA